MTGRRLPPPSCVAVDVDGTLFSSKRPRLLNSRLVALLRKRSAQGWEIIIWSMRGTAYARRAAYAAGLADVAICIAKPSVIIDDRGLEWLRSAQVVQPRADRSSQGVPNKPHSNP